MFISKHHYALELSKLGNTVYYINGPSSKKKLPENKFIIEPSGHENLFLVKHLVLQEINAGSMFKFITQEESKFTRLKKPAAFSIGAHYRVGDALIFTGMYEYSNYAIGISYDTNISKLTSASKSRGGIEISLRFVTPNQFSTTRSRI